ncbi:restriction endonuclease subunit S [Rhizobium binae]|uniref:restriction endonuclease subunit S n=1 Tax=Rhizobium binae TaxID=1138190 RepID=UPI001C8317D9|nr:restriction endonuclease subunit S [Rhizobium binae]MBX4928706.1 restriction endonuclease subunit S [Rhizobium binae]
MLSSIPEGWEEIRLGKVAREVSARNREANGTPVLSVTKHNGFVRSSEYFSKSVHSDDTSNYKVVQKGQFAYATIHLDEGSIALLKEFNRGIISPMYTVFETNTDLVCNDYFIRCLKHFALSGRFDPYSNGGVNRRKSISFSDLQAFRFALPPLAEQRAITEALSTIEGVIAKTEKLIEATTHALNKTIDWVLGETKSECAPIGYLGEVITSTKYGTSAKCDDDRSGFPVLRIPNVLSRGIDQSELKYAKLPPAEAKKFTLQDGDLLAVRTNGNPDYVGRMALIQGLAESTLYASYLIRIRVDQKKVLPEFVWLCSETFPLRDSLTAAATTSAGNFNINSDGLRSARLPIPNLAVQQRIVDAAQTLRIRRECELEYLAQLRVTHAALTQELLFGRRRLPKSMIDSHSDQAGCAA